MTVYRLIKSGELARGPGGQVVPDPRGRRRRLSGRPVHPGGLRPAALPTPSPSCPTTAPADEFVGVVKSVIRSIAPQVGGHRHHPRDPRPTTCGRRDWPWPAAPSTWPRRRARRGRSRGGHRPAAGGGRGGRRRLDLVGPDNGLLAPAVAMVGGATRAVVLDNPDYQLRRAGAHLRRAGHLRPGGRPPLPRRRPGRPRHRDRPGHAAARGAARSPGEEDGGLVAEVLWVDRFGNLQLNVDPERARGLGRPDQAAVDRPHEGVRTARRATAYDELAPGEIGLVVDSYGLMSVAVPRGSAAADPRARRRRRAAIGAADGDDRGPGQRRGHHDPGQLGPPPGLSAYP